MDSRAKLEVIMITFFVAGFGWLAFIDWRIALCVLMTHWANNARLDLERRRLTGVHHG